MNAVKTVNAVLSTAEKTAISLEILITGFVVVFAVLILLILLIMAYGKIVSSIEKRIADKKTKNDAVKESEKITEKPVQAIEPIMATESTYGVPEEVIAVITAAVYTMYGEGTVKVKSIKRVPQSRPVWSTAGIMENTRPF